MVAVVRGGAAAGATGPAAAATCPLADWQWTNTFISHHTPHHTLHRLHTPYTPHTGEGVSRAGLGSVEAAVTQP